MLTQDPIGLAGGVNLYEYAGSNPVGFDDPYGLSPRCPEPPCPKDILFAAAVAAAADGPLPIGDALAIPIAGVALGVAAGEVVRRNKPEVHHIATDKNSISDARGGPWTPRFAPLFERAGLTMNSIHNKTIVFGHRGPHPERYHQAVYDRLLNATRGKQGDAYKSAFKAALHGLAVEIAAPGTKLNQMVTKPE